MEQPPVRVQCPDCESWIQADGNSEMIRCRCGERFVVTVTHIPGVPA